MIVKESEWNELYFHKEALEKEYKNKLEEKDSEIFGLNEKIKSLEKKLKPDYIEISIYKREVDKYGYWNGIYNVQIDNCSLVLSSGIRVQILRIIRKITEELYKDILYKNEKINELTSIITENKTKTIYFLKGISKSLFTPKKKIKDYVESFRTHT